LRTLTLPFVAHIGRLDIGEKNSGSYEGAGLSVSINPGAWSQIARIGSEGFILKKEDGSDAEFVDAIHMIKEHKKSVIEWARDSALIEDREIWIASYFDTETNKRCFFECSSREEAEDEIEDLERGKVTGPKLVVTATKKLLAREGHSPDQATSSSLTFDLALMQYVQTHLDVDGVWWAEVLDVDAYSAPRGVLFTNRLDQFSRFPMDFSEFDEFDCILDEELGIAKRLVNEGEPAASHVPIANL
jgi:hypothetical protein